MSDYQVGDTLYYKFTTRAFATGVPTVLAGTPVVSIYEDDSTTQITAGITLTVDFDAVVGLNHLTVVATGANGFEAGKFYSAVITTGTVGGVSVVGETVWTFTLEASAAALDLANGTDGLGAIKSDTAAILIDTAEIGTAGAGLTNIGTIATVTTLTNKTGFSLASTGLDSIVSTATGMVEIAKSIWDRVLSDANHNIANSAGRIIRTMDSAFEVHSGTAQAGSTSTTFVMDTGASTVNDIYNGDRIVITAGTGAEEHGIIVDYVGSTRTATMSKAWVVTPDNTSDFSVVPADCDIETWNHVAVTGDGDWSEMQADLDIITDNDGVVLGAAGVDLIWNESLVAHQTALSSGRAITLGGVPIAETTMTGTPTTTSVQLTAGSTIDGAYEDHTLVVLSGMLAGQTSPIQTYTGATRTCTFAAADAFTSAGSAGDIVVVKIDHVHPVSQIRSEMDSNSTQLAKLGTPASTISADIAATKAVVDALPTITDILTTQMTEAYAADGVAPTLAQCLFLIQQALTEFAISGTTTTIKKLNGSTTAAVLTHDDATNATSATRSS